jgi:MFS family permease
VRGENTLHAAYLMVPQGLGAMLTMPVAGALADRIPVGRIVPFGLLLITGGMFALTQVGPDTSYWGFMIPVLFVMGLGMGGTMMPIMTSALKTLTAHQVARGSTLLNITQQIASSIGVAVISVVFTNNLAAKPLAGPAIAAQRDPGLVDKVGGPAAVQEGLAQAADAFGETFLVAAILVATTLVAAWFLPRRHEESHLLDDETQAAPVVVH